MRTAHLIPQRAITPAGASRAAEPPQFPVMLMYDVHVPVCVCVHTYVRVCCVCRLPPLHTMMYAILRLMYVVDNCKSCFVRHFVKGHTTNTYLFIPHVEASRRFTSGKLNISICNFFFILKREIPVTLRVYSIWLLDMFEQETCNWIFLPRALDL